MALTMTKRKISEAEITAAAKAYCCPRCDCIPAASYCAQVHDRDMIRGILEAARDSHGETGDEK